VSSSSAATGTNLAEQHRLFIDAEVRAPRHALLRALWPQGGTDAAAILDEDFLAMADRPTVYQRSWMLRRPRTGAACADLKLFDSGGVCKINFISQADANRFAVSAGSHGSAGH
jgi:hypothetical protein